MVNPKPYTNIAYTDIRTRCCCGSSSQVKLWKLKAISAIENFQRLKDINIYIYIYIFFLVCFLYERNDEAMRSVWRLPGVIDMNVCVCDRDSCECSAKLQYSVHEGFLDSDLMVKIQTIVDPSHIAFCFPFGFFKGPSRSCEPNKVFGVVTWLQFSIQPLKKSEKQTKVTCWELQAYVIHPRKLDWFVRDVLLLSSYFYLIGLRKMGRPRFKLRN